MQKEIDDARSTADPSLQYECTRPLKKIQLWFNDHLQLFNKKN